MEPNQAIELLTRLGWVHDYWWNNREFYKNPLAPRQSVFLHQGEIGIDNPYSTEIDLIYCDMTEAELWEYTQLSQRLWNYETDPEQTTLADYRDARKAHKSFVQAMRRKKSIAATVQREPGGLVEQYEKEHKDCV